MSERSGGRIVVDTLAIQGVSRVFGVPGESYLPILDALVDVPQIQFVTCRQEGGAAMMAEAHGKLSGRPGVCLVTRGPGATNAASGVHVAFQDSTPMIVLVGQVTRGERDREAFQELDYGRVFGGLAKWAAQIDDPARIPEYLARAFRTAMSGRPGPVVLALPEDVLSACVDVPDAPLVTPVESAPTQRQMTHLASLLARSRQPVVLAGEGRWSDQSRADFARFVNAWGLPVAAAFRCQEVFDNTDAHYIGDVGLGINPALRKRLAEADLVLALGTRLGEIVTDGYTHFTVPEPAQTLIHVHPDPNELGRVYQPELAIAAGVDTFCAAAVELSPVLNTTFEPWREAARDDYLRWSQPTELPGQLQYGEFMSWLRERLPADAVICNGAGNYAIWVHRFHRYRSRGSQLAPRSGSMGYGLPAAIAAKLAQPERTVVAFAGDGCLQMTIQEMATAVQHDARVILVVVNNGAYGTIRMHQERHYPGRVSGTTLANPDFVALGTAYGWQAERADTAEAAMAAFERALVAERPALVELRLPLEALTPGASLSQIRDRVR